MHSLDNGLPQASVVSPTLFNLMINDLSTTIQHQKQPYQVADLPSSQMTQKSTIHYTSGSIKMINIRLQSTLDLISMGVHSMMIQAITTENRHHPVR
jgi:hypothetical protein